MENSQLQVENGNFTRIVNPLIEELIKVPFKGCELQVAMYIIRKTYGHQKKQDSISLSQFIKGIERGRPTVVKALENLQLVNIVKLVKKGSVKGDSNVYEINKYTDSWKLVNTVNLVKRNNKPSLGVYTKPSKEVLTHKRKKEITKETRSGYNPLGAELIKLFEEINPVCKKMYNNKTQREACDDIINSYTFEEACKVILLLKQTNKIPYFPIITTPVQLRDKYQILKSRLEQKKEEIISKKAVVAF